MLRWQVLSIIPLFLVLVGCGKTEERPKLGEVKGKVTLDGAPLPSGKIVFDEGPSVPATELDIKDGLYSGQVLAGSKTVRISSYKTVPQKGPMKDQTMLENTLPAKYNTASKEVREVKEGGTNEFDFALTSK